WRLVIVGGQRSFDWLAGLVVVPDRCGQGEDAGQDAGDDALRRPAAVPFQVKLALEGPVDRFDDLPQRLEQLRGGTPGLAFADRAQHYQVTYGQFLLEVAAEVVLVADEGLPGMLVHHVAAGLEYAQERLALIGLGASQGAQHRQPGQGAYQVQPQPPEVTGVTGAIAVLRPPGGVA